MKVFLTGGTGYLGEAVLDALLSRGHEVRALSRGRPGRAAGPVEWVSGDLSALDRWSDRLSGCQGLIHTAAKVGSWGPREAFESVNVEAPLKLLGRARDAGVGRMVITGSLFGLGPTSPDQPGTEDALNQSPPAVSSANNYVLTKAELSRKLFRMQGRGDSVIQVFPTVLMGPGRMTAGNHLAKILHDIAKRRFPGLVGNGEQVWNLVGVSDAAAGHVAALEAGEPGECFILGGENWTQRRLVEAGARYLGVSPPLRAMGTRVPHAVAAVSELWARITGTRPYLTHGEVDLYNCHWCFSSEKAKRALQYQAEPVDSVLRRTVQWLKDEVWNR